MLLAAAGLFVLYANRPPVSMVPPPPAPMVPPAGAAAGAPSDAPPGAAEPGRHADEVRSAAGDEGVNPAPAPTGGQSLRLEIHPTDAVWVDAMADGQRALYELIPGGERRTIDARDDISIRVGDAGRFSFSINGVPGRVLGEEGQVRDLRITRDNYATFLTPNP
jgi:hypothetical protein